MKSKLMQKMTMAAIATFFWHQYTAQARDLVRYPVLGQRTRPERRLGRNMKQLRWQRPGTDRRHLRPRRPLGEHAYRRLRPGGGALDHSAGASCQRVEPA